MFQFLIAGLRYQSAAIDLREQVAFRDDEIRPALELLLSLPGIEEAAILATCNRSELYLKISDTYRALQSVKEFFRRQKGFDWEAHPSAVFRFLNEDALRHLYQVASGLDSQILGEGQILAQVKETARIAKEAGTSGLFLERLFQSAVVLGKRVRTETGIAQRDVNMSRAALDCVRQTRPDTLNQDIVVIGGGKMAELLIEELSRELGAKSSERLSIVNRSENRLETLCQQFSCKGVTWEGIQPTLDKASLVFVASGAPHTLIWPESFSPNTREKLIVDISMPRNVDPGVAELERLHLLNSDELGAYQAFSEERLTEIRRQADALIDEAYDNFNAWYLGQNAQGTIVRLRNKIETIRQRELAKLRVNASSQQEEINELSRALMNKLLHEPSTRLRRVGNTPEEITQAAQVIEEIFALNKSDSFIDMANDA